MKKCNSCLVIKADAEFNKHSETRDKLDVRCKICRSNQAKESYKRNRDKVLKNNAIYYQANKERYQAMKREYAKERRLRMFKILGDHCVRCSEGDKRVLQVDHIKGGGGKHRRRVNNSLYSLFKDVVENPSKYRILCANCNILTGIENGYLKSSM